MPYSSTKVGFPFLVGLVLGFNAMKCKFSRGEGGVHRSTGGGGGGSQGSLAYVIYFDYTASCLTYLHN